MATTYTRIQIDVPGDITGQQIDEEVKRMLENGDYLSWNVDENGEDCVDDKDENDEPDDEDSDRWPGSDSPR